MNIPISKVLLDKKEERAVISVLRSGWVMQGKKVEELEAITASFIGVKHAIAVSSATAGLHLSLEVLGIGRGDEVIIPSLSFIATSNCVLYVNAKPVFAEIDPRTYNIDIKDVEKKITKKTKAMIPVHQIGLPADMDAIQKICKKHHLFLIEDAACAIGSSYYGKKIGSFGDLACFSFHPRKSITTGEGGIITTNNTSLYEKLKILRSHGAVKKNDEEIFFELGYNYRMTDIQAAIGIEQFKKLRSIIKKRVICANRYTKAFSKNKSIIPPLVPKNVIHTFQSYMIKISGTKKNRDFVSKYLKKKGITTKKGIMLSHTQPLYKKLLGNVSLKTTEKVADQSLLLPLYANMTKEEQNYVILHVLNALKP